MLTLAEIRTGYHYLPRLHTGHGLPGRVGDTSDTASGCVDRRVVFKHQATDFCVDEMLPSSFAASGDGEHFWILVKKQDLNTHDVIESLARSVGCRARDIGYSGLKDRHAITTQWFSLPTAKMADRDVARNALVELPARIQADPLFAGGCELQQQFLHSRKLKPGTHIGNRFKLVLRECDAMQRQQFETRLNLIKQQGFPNYFGLQRFGIEGRNLLTYQRLSAESGTGKDRQGRGRRGRQSQQAQRARSMALSAARSVMFNAVLACRIDNRSCMQMEPGEPLMLADSSSFFICEEPDADLTKRLAAYDVLTSGPLWGDIKKQNDALLDWQLRETAWWSDWSLRCLPFETRLSPELLLQCGLQHQRRSLLCRPGKLSWEWRDSSVLKLEFTLPAGVFATALLRELCELAL